MFKPVIGISCGVEAESANWLLRSYYGEAIHALGGSFVLLPTQNPQEAFCLLQKLDGLLLAGGGDMHPEFWGEEPHLGLGRVDRKRDIWELALFHAAMQIELPVLGICRGMQLINVALGGSLWQQNPGNHCHAQTSPYEQVWHGLQITAPAFAEACGFEEAETMVNSCHHQCVRRLGCGLTVAAKAKDGIVEAIVHENSIWGVQWHPEYLWREEGLSRRLFQLFLQACAQKKQDS